MGRKDPELRKLYSREYYVRTASVRFARRLAKRHARLEAIEARIEQRFMRFVEPEPTSGCWLWIGPLTPNGYGKFWMHGADHAAHRVAYLRWRGPILPGLEIDHRCRVTMCVNPAHLDLVTHAENQRRWIAAKTHCKRGHPFDEKNTRWFVAAQANGEEKLFRACRACAAFLQRTYKAAKRERLSVESAH